MAVLRSLPRGRVAGFVDAGPAILAYTPHSAIAGPYHRDAAGILDTYEIFAGKNPRPVLDRRGIDYVMTCRGSPDWAFYGAQSGLLAGLARSRASQFTSKVDSTDEAERLLDGGSGCG